MPILDVEDNLGTVYEIDVKDDFLLLPQEQQNQMLNQIVAQQQGLTTSNTIDTTGQATAQSEFAGGELPPEEVGTIEGLGNAVGRGWNDLTSAAYITGNRLGIVDDETTANQLAIDAEDKKRYPRPDYVSTGLDEIQKQETLSGAALEALQNPGAVLDVAVQSLVSSIPSIAGMIAGAFAAPVGLLGAVARPALIRAGSMGIGAGTGSYGVEWAHSLKDAMSDEGVNLSESDEVLKFFGDEQKMRKARTYANERGVPIAAFDALSAGVAGKLFLPTARAAAGSTVRNAAEEAGELASQKATRESIEESIGLGLRPNYDDTTIAARAASRAAKAKSATELASLNARGYAAGATAELGVQALSGGSGELAAQLVSKGQMESPGDVVLEAFGELVPGSVESTAGFMINSKNKKKLLDSNILDDMDTESATATYEAPAGAVPNGTSYIRKIANTKTFNINEDGNLDTEDTVDYFDLQNNVVGQTEDIGQNIINNNIDNINEDDNVEIRSAGVWRVVVDGAMEPGFYSSEAEANQVGRELKARKKKEEAKSKAKGKEETKVKEEEELDIKSVPEQSYILEYKSPEESTSRTILRLAPLVSLPKAIKGYKFSDKYKAQNVADYINQNKNTSIKNRNDNFYKRSALFSLMQKNKAEVKKKRAELEKQGNKKEAIKEQPKKASEFTPEEIQAEEEILKLPDRFVTPQEYSVAKQWAIQTAENTASTNVALEFDRGGRRAIPKLSKKAIQTQLNVSKQKASAIYQELVNRNIITSSPGKNTILTPRTITPQDVGAEVKTDVIFSQGLEQELSPESQVKFGGRTVGDQVKIAEEQDRKTASRLRKERKEEARRRLNSTPEFLSRLRNLFAVDLKNRFIQMTNLDPENVSIDFLKTIDGAPTGAIIDFDINGKLIINIAAQGLEAQKQEDIEQSLYNAIDEEAFHIIEVLAQEGKGPLTREDIATLKREARKMRVDPRIDRSYYDQAKGDYAKISGYRNSDNSINVNRIESEAIADMFKKYINHRRGKGNTPAVNETTASIFQRLIEFFKAIKKSLKKSGFNNVDQIFSKVKEPTTIPEVDAIDPNPDNLTGEKLKEKLISDQKIEEIKTSSISPEAKAAAILAIKELIYANPENSLKISEAAKEKVRGLRQVARENISNEVKDIQNRTMGPSSEELVATNWFDGLRSLTSWPVSFVDKFREGISDDVNYIKLSSEEKKNAIYSAADLNAYVAIVMQRNSSALAGSAMGSSTSTQDQVSGPPVFRNGLTRTEPVTVTRRTIDEQGNVTEEEVTVEGIADNLSEVFQNGTTEEYHLYHMAKRVKSILGRNPDSVQIMTKEEADTVIAEMEQKFSYFIESQKKMDEFNKIILKYRLDTGQITQEKYDEVMQYDNYIPIYSEEGIDKSTSNLDLTENYEQQEVQPVETLGITIEDGKKVRAPKAFDTLKGKKKLYRIKVDGKYLPNKKKGGAFYAKTPQEAQSAINRENLPSGTNVEIEQVQQPVDNMMANYVKYVQKAISNGTKNIAAQRVVRDQIRLDMARETPTKEGSNVTIFIRGKEAHFRLDDQEVFDALMSMNEPGMDFFQTTAGQYATLPANLLRAFITKEPGFMIANFLRDSISASFTTGRIETPIWSSIKGGMEAITNSPAKLALLRAGIRGGPDFADAAGPMATKELEKLRKRRYPKGFYEVTTQPLRKFWGAAERLVEISDLATRIAVYNNVLERTGNEAQAIWEAQEVINFRKRGKYVKFLAPLIPFLNARIQGLDVVARGFLGRGAAATGGQVSRAELRKRFFIRAGYLIALSSALYLLQAGDEDYEDIKDYIKDQNYILLPKYLNLPEGFPPITIPKGFEVSLIFSTIPERILGQILGDPKNEATRSLKQNLYGTLFPGVPPFVAPILENAFNYNLLSGQTILNPSEIQRAETSPEDVKRFTDSNLANALAGTAGLTGPEWQNLINKMFGKLGEYAVSVVDHVIPSDVVKPEKHWSDYPVIERFFQQNRGRGLTEDFYATKRLLDSYNNALNYTQKQYDPQQSVRQREGQPYFNAQFEIRTLGKRIRYISDQISGVRDLPTRVYKNLEPNITNKEIAKRKQQDINDLQRELRGLQSDLKYVRKIISDQERRQ